MQIVPDILKWTTVTYRVLLSGSDADDGPHLICFLLNPCGTHLEEKTDVIINFFSWK